MIALASFAGFAGAAPVGDAPSSVSITSVKDGKISGRVTSPEPSCVPKRTVKLVAGAGGKGRELDRDQADSAGHWEAKVDDLKPGTVVSAKVTPGFSIGFNCLSATSLAKRVGGNSKK